MWIIVTLLILSLTWAEPQPGGNHGDKVAVHNFTRNITDIDGFNTTLDPYALTSTTEEGSRDDEKGTGTLNIPNFLLTGGICIFLTLH